MSMCGGIVAALSFTQQGDNRRRHGLQVSYNLGRITTYALLGGLAAALAGATPEPGVPIGRTLAGLLLIFLGLHFLGRSRAMIGVERLGQGVWRWLKPAASALVPVRHPAQAFVAGAVWGWLPCGLVYSALVYAATQGSFAAGAGVMLAFGAGTLPALLIGGMAAAKLQTWFKRQRVRQALAWGYIAFGLWTIAVPWYHLALHEHPQTQQEQGEHRYDQHDAAHHH